MRKINITETLKAVNFISTNGLEEEVNRMALIAKNGKKINVREVGIQFIVSCIGKLTTDTAISQAMELLSGPFEIDAKELSAMPAEEFMKLIVEFADTIDEENIKGFFKSVSALKMKFK